MRLQLGKKLDVAIGRKPDGAIMVKAKYVEVKALKVNGKSLADYIVMTAKKRKFAHLVYIYMAIMEYQSSQLVCLRTRTEPNLSEMWRRRCGREEDNAEEEARP